MKKNNSGLIILLVFIIIILSVLCLLFATNIISFNFEKTDVNETNENNNETSDNNENIEIDLPSGRKVTINKKYEKVFKDEEKIIVKVDDNKFAYFDSKIANNSEALLSEYLSSAVSEYPDDIYTGKGIKISDSSFDFDNDGVNEIMFSFCESYILLHYYDNKIYGYLLNGYRSNFNWRVNGTSRFSSSANVGGIAQYSFDSSKLNYKVIAIADSDYDDSGNIKREYKINEKNVTKEELDSFIKEQDKIEIITFINYSE